MNIIAHKLLFTFTAINAMNNQLNNRIRILTDKYIALSQQFIDALEANKSSEELAALKHEIKATFQEIEQLEHSGNAANKNPDNITFS